MGKTSIEVEGYTGYFVTCDGSVFNSTMRLLKGSFDRYRYVRLKKGNAWVKCYIHRLVATAYVAGKSQERSHVNHIDGNKLNNHFSNLEWVSQADNNRHAYKKGLIPSSESHHWSHLTTKVVLEIRRLRGIEKQASLAERFNTTQANVSAIQLRKTHKNTGDQYGK